MKKKMICIGIVSMFLITILAGVVSADTYRGVICNLQIDDKNVAHATSLVGGLFDEDDEKLKEFCFMSKIKIKGTITLSPTALLRFPIMNIMLTIFDSIILPIIISEGRDASKE